MKKVAFTIITILIVNASLCQANSVSQASLDSVSKIVIHFLQAKQSDSIYAMAGEAFKSQLTPENFNSVAQGQVFPLNDFSNTTFVNTTNGINKYKVTGNPVLQLLIGLDKANKLQTLLVQPFSDN